MNRIDNKKLAASKEKARANLEEVKSPSEITPLIKSLKGSFNVPANFDYKKALTKGLSEKLEL